MMPMTPSIDPIFLERWHALSRRMDRMFGVLMPLQWAAVVVLALTISTWSWAGGKATVHPHVWSALLFGGGLIAVPCWMVWSGPGWNGNRYAIAVTEMLLGSLVVHVLGGRIEGHFFFFGTLAFLTCYRDYTVLLVATAVTAVDHLIGDWFFPRTFYGVEVTEGWRWLEHAAWVIYEDVILIWVCREGRRELWNAARNKGEIDLLHQREHEQAAALHAQSTQEIEELNRRQAELEEHRRERERVLAEQRLEAERVAQRVEALLDCVEVAAGGDLSVTVPVVSDDPLGRVGRGIQRLLHALRPTISGIDHEVQHLEAASHELQVAGEQMNGTAAKTAGQADLVTAAAGKLADSIQTVNASVEQLRSSILEVSQNTSRAKQVARTAVDITHRTTTIIQELGSSSNEIGDVVKMIFTIAGQTRLLALNASIEATRAGTAGNSFRVVATEVKDLARETDAATEEIARKIERIQLEVGHAVESIAQIATVVQQINDFSALLAVSMANQSETLERIGQAIASTTAESLRIRGSIQEMLLTADQTRETSGVMKQRSRELADVSLHLSELIDRFEPGPAAPAADSLRMRPLESAKNASRPSSGAALTAGPSRPLSHSPGKQRPLVAPGP